MAEIVMCEPQELYNLLNQSSRNVSRLAEINYLCLMDAREAQDYKTSHIPTARHANVDSEGTFLLPEAVEVDSMHHVVVYDSNTSCLEEKGRAAKCAQVFAKVSLYPVKILKGGFERFSALYTFLRTEKILYTILELDNLKTYPVEIIAGRLYMSDEKQSMDSSILKDLKISAVVCISESDTVESTFTKGNRTILSIPAADTDASDLSASFERICSFIASNFSADSRVLIVSKHGRSRCSAVTIAFLMHHLKYTLEEAWKHMCKCKPNMRPNTGFLKQLSDWELHTTGTRVTDISEPFY
ncbi:serine/threonine/tyrosine-interacting-like protein 1 [Cheilinus undulatus]|uniref:serine/threonine/tyrosine-interacting-like protein 1 n=1 Tax=Cheilinus undulatus TaxID=241271 RepID=UPI001BD45650|nr:serine/threonine/tyrosine-interacting-like protein 1 [Cheilinus undulatus]